jgi:hypothetical protein
MKSFAGLATVFFSIVALAASSKNPVVGRIWITDVTIISPDNLENVGVGSLLIENGRIARIEHTKGSRVPHGAQPRPLSRRRSRDKIVAGASYVQYIIRLFNIGLNYGSQ